MVATPQLFRAWLLGDGQGAAPQLYEAGMDASGTAVAQPLLFGAEVTSDRTAQPLLFGAYAAPAGMTIEIGPSGTAYSYDTCQVVGVSRTEGLTPDYWRWRVVSVVPPLPAGRGIALVGSGNRVVYIAPATKDGCVITIEAVGEKVGYPDSVATVEQTITAHGWEWTGPDLSIPVRGPQVWGPPPDAAYDGTGLSDLLTDLL